MNRCMPPRTRLWSPSSRRAWVEIPTSTSALTRAVGVALLAEGVGRNSYKDCAEGKSDRSPSSRRAWVEIGPLWQSSTMPEVALLAEGVGRNYSIKTRPRRSAVALLAEGVGRNYLLPGGRPPGGVALLAEGVGRNSMGRLVLLRGGGRPPRGGRG